MSKNKNILIGSHTLSHPILTKCSENLVKHELTESKNILEKWLEKPIKSFAYPNGEYRAREIEILKESGYEIAFSTKQQYLTTENRNQRSVYFQIKKVYFRKINYSVCNGLKLEDIICHFNFLNRPETPLNYQNRSIC